MEHEIISKDGLKFFAEIAHRAMLMRFDSRHPIAGLRAVRGSWAVSASLHPVIREHVLTSNEWKDMFMSGRACWILNNVDLFQPGMPPAIVPSEFPRVSY